MMSRLADWMARRTRGTAGRRPTPVILMYHRVACTRHDPWALAVQPERFGRQMDWLSRHRMVLPMDEFVALMKRDRLPRTAVGLTFDDGYVDNLTAAKPVLERHNLPATVFALGDRQGAEPFWWDELADLVLACPQAKDEQLSIGTETVRLCWKVHQSEQTGEVWHAHAKPREGREAAYLQIWRILQAMSPEGRSEALARLRAVLPEPAGAPALRMTPAQLAKATGDGPLSLGRTWHDPFATVAPDCIAAGSGIGWQSGLLPTSWFAPVARLRLPLRRLER